ncbi:MAG TPA: acyltransferase [Rickettsiales bacterium]|nr:acyltransferase [Rickettsiales bacterium]
MEASHRNNFDFLRFVAAVLVWYGHCYTLGALPDPMTRFVPFGTFADLGVAVFCVISGYFVTRSYEINERLLPFIRNRALRILPALVVVILLTVFVIGPVSTKLSPHAYFVSPLTFDYLHNLLIFPVREHLPDVFKDNASDVVNGSLWVLPHGVRFYGVIALLGVLGILQPRLLGVILLGLFAVRIYGAVMHLHSKQVFFGHAWSEWEVIVRLASEFAAGAFLYLARERVPPSLGGFAIAAVVAGVSIYLPYPAVGYVLFDMTIAYCIICFGFMRLPLLHGFGGWGDFSYGFYLYAFVMQQFFLHLLGNDADFRMFQLASFCATFLCAVLSWHLVEKRALALKT